MSYNILVTGSAGYLGSTMVPDLLAAGHKVTVLDNFMFKQASLNHCAYHPDFSVVKGDIRVEKTIVSLMQRADVVIPLAAVLGAPLCNLDPVGATIVNHDAITLMLRLLSHRNQEVRELIPSDQGGVMHTDRALTYDAWALELLAQQKCDHIIRSIDKVLEDKAGSVRAFGETLKTLLKDAIALWQRYHAGGVDDYTREAQNITQAIDRHLKPRSLDDPDNQRLLDQIGWHHAGGSLLPFLDQPEGAEPTNNRAERALRPGVTARKVSHCSKSAGGARTPIQRSRPSSRPHANVESLWSAGSWTCSVLTVRHLIRFLPTPLPVHPDNIQPSGDASPQDQATREAASLINYFISKTTRMFYSFTKG